MEEGEGMSYHVYLTVPEDQVELADGCVIIDTGMAYGELIQAVIDCFMGTGQKARVSICEVDDGE